MLWILQNIVVSIIIIISIHYLFNYLKDTYSIKKTKDLVKTQTDKYKNILDEIMYIDNSLVENVKDLNNRLEYFIC